MKCIVQELPFSEFIVSVSQSLIDKTYSCLTHNSKKFTNDIATRRKIYTVQD